MPFVFGEIKVPVVNYDILINYLEKNKPILIMSLEKNNASYQEEVWKKIINLMDNLILNEEDYINFPYHNLKRGDIVINCTKNDEFKVEEASLIKQGFDRMDLKSKTNV